MEDPVEEHLLQGEDSVALEGEEEILEEGEGASSHLPGEAEAEQEPQETYSAPGGTQEIVLDDNDTEEENQLLGSDDKGDTTAAAPLDAVKEERAAVGEITVTEVTTQYLAVHQELLTRPVQDSDRRGLLVGLLGEESVNGPRAEELLGQFPLLSLLHGKHKSQGGLEESFWANVAAAAASGVHLNSPAPTERETEREERENSGLSQVTVSAVEVRTGEDTAEKDSAINMAASERAEEISAHSETTEKTERKIEVTQESEGLLVTEKTQQRTPGGDRRAAAMALSSSGRESIELDMEEEEEDSLVMEIGEKENPARYIVSAVMAVIKIVIVLALLQEYEAPLLFYLYPILWVFIFFLLIIRAVQILIANKSIDKANARLATELLPLDPHSDEEEEEEAEYDVEEEGCDRS